MPDPDTPNPRSERRAKRPDPASGGKKRSPQRHGKRRDDVPPTSVLLFGLHPVRAALANPARRHKRLLVTQNAETQLAEELTACPNPPIVERSDPGTLAKRVPDGAVHQGCVLETAPLPAADLTNILDTLDDGAVLMILDQVTDPHNVGAILRSCAAFAATALILQQRHSPPESGTLAKSASGALDLTPIAHVPNLARALDDIAAHGLTILGLDDAAPDTMAETLADPGRVHPTAPLAVVLGAEGPGLRALTRQKCTHLVKLPTAPAMPSLNVSNAAAVALYAIQSHFSAK